MADEENFDSSAPMLFGEEFVKATTARVDQVKAMKKISKPEESKEGFSGYHPQNYQAGCGSGYKSSQGRYQP